jgi:hypothetical protein
MKQQIYYCKSLKKTGKPIIVKDLETGKETTTDEIEMKNVNIKIKYGNSKGKAKASGATTVLEVWNNE